VERLHVAELQPLVAPSEDDVEVLAELQPLVAPSENDVEVLGLTRHIAVENHQASFVVLLPHQNVPRVA
jgi:hypothetical protein